MKPSIKVGTHTLQEITALAEENGISLMDAILEYCSKNNIELEYIPTIVKRSDKFRTRLLEESQRLNLVKEA